MAELEKVIKAFENCTDPEMNDYDETITDCIRAGVCHWDGCQERGRKMIDIPLSLAMAALELLKAQEPVVPYIDYDGQDVWRCGSCGATLFHLSHTQADENEQNCVKFCRYCGKAVKWE